MTVQLKNGKEARKRAGEWLGCNDLGQERSRLTQARGLKLRICACSRDLQRRASRRRVD